MNAVKSAVRIVVIVAGLVGLFFSWNSGFMLGCILSVIVIFAAMLTK